MIMKGRRKEMKNFKRLTTLLLTIAMMLVMTVSTFAQTKAYTGADGDGAKITISNAANGETYKIAKLFDATVSVAETDGVSDSIAYQGDIPESLSAYFTKDTAGNISATAALVLSDDDVQDALKTWAEANVTDQAVSDGTVLEFTGLPYGYYIITTTQGETLLTVNSTKPNATVIDKNTTDTVGGLKKETDEGSQVVSIGDTVTYTVSFTTANYDEDANQITKYVISDTLPDFLTDVKITSLTVGGTELLDADESGTVEASEYATFTDKAYTVTWAEDGKSLYANNAQLVITYTAVVTDKIAAGNVTTNVNKVTVKPYAGTTELESDDAEVTIKTYAAAVQKVNGSNEKLAGATFQVPGLTVSGSAGNYTVVSYDPSSATAGTTMEMDDDGFLVIRGLSNEETITIYEVDAPDGYNKLTEGKTLPVIATEEVTTTTSTTTTTYYDADGNVVDTEEESASSTSKTTLATNDDLVAGQLTVINETGTTLPSTGGIGTTMFYTVGTLLVLGAGVYMISKRKMSAE